MRYSTHQHLSGCRLPPSPPPRPEKRNERLRPRDSELGMCERIFQSQESENAQLYGESIAHLERRETRTEYLNELAAAMLPTLQAYCARENMRVIFHYSTSSLFVMGVSSDPYGNWYPVSDDQTDLVYHEVRVDPIARGDFREKAGIILHEFGHAFNEQIKRIAQENKREIIENNHSWEDMFSCTALYPEFMEAFADNPNKAIRDTIWCMQKMVEDCGIAQARDQVHEILNKKKEVYTRWVQERFNEGDDPKHYYPMFPWMKPGQEHRYIPFGMGESLYSLLYRAKADIGEVKVFLEQKLNTTTEEKQQKTLELLVWIMENYIEFEEKQ